MMLLQQDVPASESSASSAPSEDSASIADTLLGIQLQDHIPDSLKSVWESLQSFPLLLAVLIIVAGYFLGWTLKALTHRLVEDLVKSKASELDYRIAHYLTSPIWHTVVTLSIAASLLVLNLPHALERILLHVLLTALLLLWARAWFRATSAILEALESNRQRFPMFQERTVPLFEMGFKLILLGLFIYLLLLIWGVNATAWIASAGVIGIVVGFAARDTLANLISGISIVADAPYKIGDYIVLETGERGVVTNLGIRSTRVLTRDDVEISIPNAIIGSTKILNESGGPWVKHRIRIPVGVAYGSDTQKVIEVLESVAKENTTVAENPAPRVRMRGFGDSSLDMELLVWVQFPQQRGMVVHELLLEIDRRFREESIVIPFPQRDVHLDKQDLRST